jgi:putative flippase GtrA
MLSSLIKLFSSKEFLLFLVVGGFAALVNFSSRIIYSQYVDFSLAIILAYITGMITAFILSRVFVFGTSVTSAKHQVLYFTLVNLVAVLQTWAVSILLYKHVFVQINDFVYAKEAAHFIGVVVPVFSSYIGHKYVTFK